MRSPFEKGATPFLEGNVLVHSTFFCQKGAASDPKATKSFLIAPSTRSYSDGRALNVPGWAGPPPHPPKKNHEVGG